MVDPSSGLFDSCQHLPVNIGKVGGGHQAFTDPPLIGDDQDAGEYAGKYLQGFFGVFIEDKLAIVEYIALFFLVVDDAVPVEEEGAAPQPPEGGVWQAPSGGDGAG